MTTPITITDGKDIRLNQISAVCPKCNKNVVLMPLGTGTRVTASVMAGQFKCPDRKCNGLVYLILNGGSIMESYPPIRMDFKKDNVPPNIVNTFCEALDCHSISCYVSSAIMVRRTLEEICIDRGATGSNLKKRISDLKSKIILPQELIEALDDLRLLGNDAAHIESQTFQNVSKQELDVAIEITIEILKGLYQYSELLGKIKSLKK